MGRAAARSLAAALVAAVAVAACGPAGAPGPRRIDLELKEFSFSRPTIALKAGERVTLALRNVGTVEHEIMAGRFGAGGKGYAQDLFTGVAHEVVPMQAMHGARHGAMAGGAFVTPGATVMLTFTVLDRPGTYEFGCFVAGHYESGMKGTLTIE